MNNFETAFLIFRWLLITYHLNQTHVRLALMLAINFELFGYISVHFGEVLTKFILFSICFPKL